MAFSHVCFENNNKRKLDKHNKKNTKTNTSYPDLKRHNKKLITGKLRINKETSSKSHSAYYSCNYKIRKKRNWYGPQKNGFYIILCTYCTIAKTCCNNHNEKEKKPIQEKNAYRYFHKQIRKMRNFRYLSYVEWSSNSLIKKHKQNKNV